MKYAQTPLTSIFTEFASSFVRFWAFYVQFQPRLDALLRPWTRVKRHDWQLSHNGLHGGCLGKKKVPQLQSPHLIFHCQTSSKTEQHDPKNELIQRLIVNYSYVILVYLFCSLQLKWHDVACLSLFMWPFTLWNVEETYKGGFTWTKTSENWAEK